MGNFRTDPKLYDTLNDEQRDLLNETLNQYKVVVEKELQKDFSTKTETLKNEWLQEQEAYNNALKEKESFLSSIPNENNKKLINDLLELGKTQDDIKNNYSHLLEQEKGIYLDLNSIANAENEIITAEDEKIRIKKLKNAEFDINNQKDREDYLKYKKKGLI